MGVSGIMKEFFMGFSEKFRKIYRKNDVQQEMNKCTFEKDYMERVVEKNRSVCLFISTLSALFQLFNLYRVFFRTNGTGISTPNNFIYFSFYLSLLLLCVLYLYLDKVRKISGMKLYWIHMVGVTLFLLWQTMFNIYDVIRSESPGNLTLSVSFMAFSAIFMMKPLYFSLNLGGMSALFLFTAGRTVTFGVKYNYVLMVLLCVVVYFQRYRYEKRELSQSREMESVKQAYRAEHERSRLTHEQYEIVCRSSQIITFRWDVKTGSAYFSEQWNTVLGHPLYIPNLVEFIKEIDGIQSADRERVLECAENVKNKVPYQRMELNVRGKDGAQHWYEVRVTTQENDKGEPVFGIGTLLDIMEQKQEIKRIRRRAELDFTGALNKAAVEKYGRERIKHLRAEETFIMLVLDLDNFKCINDTWGHLAGDHVLTELVSYMKENAIPGMQIGRIGGDEFVALYAGTDTLGLRLVDDFAKKIQKYTQSERLADGMVPVSVSIGIAALGREENKTFDELYTEADRALYEAKRAGKGRTMWGGVSAAGEKHLR